MHITVSLYNIAKLHFYFNVSEFLEDFNLFYNDKFPILLPM
ncbi:hypothetical protein BCE_2375 [Bacillus cereus ATCC 10987]|uniref:Uncharacterized protein n=1 Tax=Bacillus cereus (strain ATCC 10987 / NRS 248) TaxID=222523 RepID=Q738L9_BACC1|nr:hypothetical protein BCE_2375 [Bacillus cereus ATCC 10987]